MRYFRLVNDEKNAMPRVINWYPDVNPKKFVRENAGRLPHVITLDMKLDIDFVYTDVITNPFLLLSKEASGIVHMYDETIPLLCVVLFEKEKGENAVYYMPLLEEAESGSLMKMDRPIFKMRQGVNGSVIVRMDLAESLLMREATGMTLAEVF